MKKAATPGCFCPDGRLILVILHVVIHFRQLYDLSRIDYTFSPSSLSIRTKVINALGILSPKGQRVPLAASTRDNSPASSRSLMCSKPVTSLTIASSKVLCTSFNTGDYSPAKQPVADVQQARHFFSPCPSEYVL